MWLLEHTADAFQGRRLWLRPGKTYLFGRTGSAPGELAVFHKTISRKHMTITVCPVQTGDAEFLDRRPRLTVQDLGTKTGTLLDGKRLMGEWCMVSQDQAEFEIGQLRQPFRISWFPVVFSFSFSSKELKSDPMGKLRQALEPLGVKLLLDFDRDATTHLVVKKRNTAKGLQALIGGKYLVADSFVAAVETAAAGSVLEGDFDGGWPNALDHLPARGSEAVEQGRELYGPDAVRQGIFDGYTFVFYDSTQFHNLLAPITDGRGKALLWQVVPDETPYEDFVLHVKTVAGEKGLGSLEDGSEGRGVVVVRYVPPHGDTIPWYQEFFRLVSLRLDHRPIEQSEFLEAILTKQPGILRRRLEVEGEVEEATGRPSGPTQSGPTDADDVARRGETGNATQGTSLRLLRGGRERAPVKRRFAGFDDNDEMTEVSAGPAPEAPAAAQAAGPRTRVGVGVEESVPTEGRARRSQGKRVATSPLPPNDESLLDDMAPTAAARKRQRLANGEGLEVEEQTAPSQASVTREGAGKDAVSASPKPKKARQPLDVLDVARKRLEEGEEEARARAERDDLAQSLADNELLAIRDLAVVEEAEVAVWPAGEGHRRSGRTREQDIADSRWDPRWNGLPNFKKFQRRGVPVGRARVRAAVPLVEVRRNEFGIGDDYWIEDGQARLAKPNASIAPPSGRADSEVCPNSEPKREQGQQMLNKERSSLSASPLRSASPAAAAPRAKRTVGRAVPTRGRAAVAPGRRRVVLSDDSDGAPSAGDTQSELVIQPPPPQTATDEDGSATGGRWGSATRSAAGGKRAAGSGELAAQRAKKKPRTAQDDSDESDEAMKFRFGRRR